MKNSKLFQLTLFELLLIFFLKVNLCSFLTIHRMDNSKCSQLLFQNSGGNYVANIHTTNTVNGSLIFRVGPNNSDPQSLPIRLIITNNSRVGVNTNNPGGHTLAVNGSAAKPGGGSWSTFSNIRLKKTEGEYKCDLKEIVKLASIRYHYKKKMN
ncbi:MAG: hypothetical protein DRP68_01415 [Candidatus Omnitrophota bacterium]|nr:MAG: hypothetical protein DRP68_01415 [Candidatus Omnitrophota bacterium]RKY46281.1 MAG: hypothetical protein DRP81_00960 [Candidatus Omnitrophota bacterium]